MTKFILSFILVVILLLFLLPTYKNPVVIRNFINKEEFHKVAQELQMEASLKKSIEVEIDDPDYDPWESLNSISGQS